MAVTTYITVSECVHCNVSFTHTSDLVSKQGSVQGRKTTVSFIHIKINLPNKSENKTSEPDLKNKINKIRTVSKKKQVNEKKDGNTTGKFILTQILIVPDIMAQHWTITRFLQCIPYGIRMHQHNILFIMKFLNHF